MAAGSQAVKAASPLRKRLRIYTTTKNGSIAQFETVTATARPWPGWWRPIGISKKCEAAARIERRPPLRIAIVYF